MQAAPGVQAAPGKGRGRGRTRLAPTNAGAPATSALLLQATRALHDTHLQLSLPETPPITPCPSPPKIGDHCNVQRRAQCNNAIGITPAARAGAFPVRPAYGKEGRPIALLANHFELQLPTGLFYHYDVEIGSVRHTGTVQSVISKDCKRRVFQLLVRQHEHHLNGNMPVFDGQKNMYTRRSLNFKKKDFTVTMEEEGRKPDTFVVSVQYAATIDMSLLQAVYDKKLKEVPQVVVQALDIVLRYGPSTVHSLVGRSVFTPPKNGYNGIGGGLELWHGYQTSVRPAQWKPLLNVNTVATAFFEGGPLLELVSKVLGDRRGNFDLRSPRKISDKDFVTLNKRLKRLKVKVTHLPYPRKFVIERVTRATASELKFGEPPISVAAYFASKYRPLQFPHLPCIEVGTKKNFIPLEVCIVLDGQHCRQKLNENQTATVVKKAAVPPAERFQNIQAAVQDCINNNQDYLDHFGIHISTNPVKVQARVLPAPDVLYKDNAPVSPKNGAWELQGTQFYKPANMTTWSVLSLCNSRFCPLLAIEKFVTMMISHGRRLGMSVEHPKAIKECRWDAAPLDILKKEKAAIPGLQIVFLVVGNTSPYSGLKNAAETEVGIMTQCVRDTSITNKCNPMLIVNILQKVNAKLGGTNNTIPKSVKSIIFSRPVIVMGADVTHPGAKEFNRPSIAAVVASTDPCAFRYITAFRIQKQNMEVKARVEIIEDMKNVAKELLLGFYLANNKVRPEKILFYRDGVSEGQFQQVLDYELAAIRAACTELEPGYEPGITFLTVQKRHHTRFMPENRRDGCGKMGNIPPGTTVDTTVTHPVDFDFFLCSHFGIQGTSRPAHYYILWDDNDFPPDALQKLTYGLCHTYARCARSVSIPVPVYYAHHAAQRAKCYVDARSNVYDSGSSSGGSLPSMEFLDAAINVQSFMKESMFFV